LLAARRPAIFVGVSASLLQSARTISVLTLASRVLGLLRDVVCGYVFGVSGVWSAFTIAFQVPNLFRRLFGEGALSAASIPVLTETLTRQGRGAVDVLAGRLVGLLLAVLVGVCLAGEVVVAGLYWWYRCDGDSAFTLALTALMLPYLILICAVAVLGGVQNVFGRFALPAAMSIVLNVFMIAAALTARWLVPENLRAGVVLLAAVVMVAGIAQVTCQWIGTRRCGLRLRPGLNVSDPAIRRIAVTMLPMIAGLGAVQINALLDALIAWWFVFEPIGPAGRPERVGPAILYFAQRLYQFPLGVFAIALATAIFPALARHAAQKDLPGLSHTLSRGIRIATFEALPCLVGLILIREPLVTTLFKRGQFAEWPEATDRVALTLCMYALGIWAYAINQLIVRAFYAVGDARTPVKISVANVALNLVLNLVLVQTLLRESGLALATSICAVIQVKVLVIWFHRRVGGLPWLEITTSVARSVAAAAVMGAVVLALDRYAVRDLVPLTRLFLLVGVGALSYVACAWLFKCGELREMLRR